VSWAMTERNCSPRRACALVGIDPRVYRYRSTRSDDGPLRERLRELSAERRGFGYRRLHLLLRREGWAVNWKKLYRISREEKLAVAAAAAASAPWARGHRSRSHRGRSSAGASPSPPTRCAAEGGSGGSA
jgi:transposase InsO family protein